MRNTIFRIYIIASISALVSAVNYPQPTCYRKTAHFATCTDKYQALPGHLNCRFPFSGHPDNASDEAEIVHIHNRLRSSVRPTAGDMIQVEYINGLKHTAQRWTRLCSTESSWFERTTPGAFITGQNTYRSSTKVPWKYVLNVWIAENASFTYNGSANIKDRVGNYTQMISAPTTGLGCAVSDCHGFYLYMCLYVPILNPADINTPYKKSKVPCGDCLANRNTTANLCECNGVTCLGGSTLNLTTCECDCIKTMGDPDMYNGTLCELICRDPHGDDPACGRPPFTNDSCDTNMETMFHCPYMCYVCPYAGKDYSIGAERLPWEKGLSNCTTMTTITKASTTAVKARVGRSSLSTMATGSTVTGTLNHKENSVSCVMQDGALSMISLASGLIFKWMHTYVW